MVAILVIPPFFAAFSTLTSTGRIAIPNQTVLSETPTFSAVFPVAMPG
jgi:hypothetical protein